MQNFKNLYLELAQKISDNLPEIEWIDLWHSQVYNLAEEHPFPTPAVFLAFRSAGIKNIGVKVQQVTLQVDVFLFFETFADTYKGGINQDEALAFLQSMDNINRVLHCSSGEHYSSMSRKSFSPLDTGGSSNLYMMTYECLLMDYSANVPDGEGTFADMEVERFIVEP
jgi:hypothetical protein